mmetsp:Transcript_12665/g.11222  ORF Transcript_12665/g.11222 Transcript_12665/m.11222 type:complete len:108 (-) Transcript_12665:844-1167(-)
MDNTDKGFFEQKRHEVLAIGIEDCQTNNSMTLTVSNDKYIALGTNDGYKIFTLNPIKLIKEKDLGGGIAQIGFYSSDKIIWFVGGGDLPAVPDNEFRLWDNHTDEEL